MRGRDFVWVLALAGLITGCTTPPNSHRATTPARTVALLSGPSTVDANARALAERIKELSPTIDPAEADAVAASSFGAARELRIEYAVVGPAVFHNFLINVGIRKRGLCYQWAQDLIARLDALSPQSLELRWGVAHRRGLREHNCVVVTAHGQPFRDGVVLDGWRNGGQLYYGPVSTDRYPWVEDDWDWRAHTPPYSNPR